MQFNTKGLFWIQGEGSQYSTFYDLDCVKLQLTVIFIQEAAKENKWM